MSEPSSAYKKVIGGGLKFKGDSGGGLFKKKTQPAAVDKALALNKSHTGFKPKHDPLTKPEPGLAPSSNSAQPSSSSNNNSGVPSASAAGAVIAHPVVLAAGPGRSSWGLHKDELREIDANLAELREKDKAIERMDPAEKKELVLREKRAIQEQVSNMVSESSLPPGVKFSVPNMSMANRNNLIAKEIVSTGNASARLDQRSKAKADRYCK